jgi:hypothetical protein
MARSDFVVSVGDYKHCARTINPASEEFEQIEGRLIGPVHVLEYNEGRSPPLQFVECGVEDDFAMGRGIDSFEQYTLGLARHVVQRREGSRREQRVAGTPENPPRPLPLGKLLDEGGLADAGLAADQCNAAATFSGRQPLLEVNETLFPFEQRYRRLKGIHCGLSR